MKEKFIDKAFSVKSLELIETANMILRDYARQGYRLSLRQLYYQLVARDYIENTVKSYKRVGGIVSDARLAGLMDWNMIEDRGRESIIPSHWTDPAEIVEAAARSFKIDRWEGQPAYVEVMVEKDALSGILEPVCRQLDVRFSANKGYSSSSALYEAGKRYAAAANEGRELYVMYLGDHDPSGIDMTRDITERIEMFSGCGIEVNRLALNMDQVETWNPPKNPAKETDSRFASYLEEHGESSWELDAVEPRNLAALVRDAIDSLIDPDQWSVIGDRENEMRAELRKFVEQYNSGKDQ